MFDKFGEFNSADELNKAAAGFLNEGDTQSLMELAKENGIDPGDAEDYVDGIVPELATVLTAAEGRLMIEKDQIMKMKEVIERIPLMVIWEMAHGMMMSVDGLPEAIMKKGKRIEKIYKAMRNHAEKHKKGNMGISCGTDRELRGIIRSYYMSGEGELDAELEKLYQ